MPTLPFQDLPVADRTRSWDSDAAEGRVRAWATTDGKVDFDRYRRAFMWVEPGEEENLTGYKFPFADVIDGRLRIVPRGVFATAGGRGITVSTLSREDQEKAKRLATRYYMRISDQLEAPDIVSPFAEGGLKEVCRRAEGIVASLVEAIGEARATQAPAGTMIPVWSPHGNGSAATLREQAEAHDGVKWGRFFPQPRLVVSVALRECMSFPVYSSIRIGGARHQLHVRPDEVRVISEGGANNTGAFPLLAAELKRWAGSNRIREAVLDAEIACCEEGGLPIANVSDLVMLNGRGLHSQPFKERWEALSGFRWRQATERPRPERGYLNLIPHLPSEGPEALLLETKRLQEAQGSSGSITRSAEGIYPLDGGAGGEVVLAEDHFAVRKQGDRYDVVDTVRNRIVFSSDDRDRTQREADKLNGKPAAPATR